MMTYIESTLWAKKQFGQADLNDPRRTQRLVALATSLAKQPGIPVSKLIISPADMEGAYRFIRNEQIKAEDIAEAGFLCHSTRSFRATNTACIGRYHISKLLTSQHTR